MMNNSDSNAKIIGNNSISDTNSKVQDKTNHHHPLTKSSSSGTTMMTSGSANMTYMHPKYFEDHIHSTISSYNEKSLSTSSVGGRAFLTDTMEATPPSYMYSNFNITQHHPGSPSNAHSVAQPNSKETMISKDHENAGHSKANSNSSVANKSNHRDNFTNKKFNNNNNLDVLTQDFRNFHFQRHQNCDSVNEDSNLIFSSTEQSALQRKDSSSGRPSHQSYSNPTIGIFQQQLNNQVSSSFCGSASPAFTPTQQFNLYPPSSKRKMSIISSTSTSSTPSSPSSMIMTNQFHSPLMASASNNAPQEANGNATITIGNTSFNQSNYDSHPSSSSKISQINWTRVLSVTFDGQMHKHHILETLESWKNPPKIRYIWINKSKFIIMFFNLLDSIRAHRVLSAIPFTQVEFQNPRDIKWIVDLDDRLTDESKSNLLSNQGTLIVQGLVGRFPIKTIEEFLNKFGELKSLKPFQNFLIIVYFDVRSSERCKEQLSLKGIPCSFCTSESDLTVFARRNSDSNLVSFLDPWTCYQTESQKARQYQQKFHNLATPTSFCSERSSFFNASDTEIVSLNSDNISQNFRKEELIKTVDTSVNQPVMDRYVGKQHEDKKQDYSSINRKEDTVGKESFIKQNRDGRNMNADLMSGSSTITSSIIATNAATTTNPSSISPQKVDLVSLARRIESRLKGYSPKQGIVKFTDIASGKDKRTTFMLRNIPNKYTQEMLIEFLNETHKGKYDFLYLRIDFVNDCNVGYAFINFTDASSILTFADRCIGMKWTRFNSDKITMLSFANVQGTEALIEKFRNSSIMLEQLSYRPKLFDCPSGEEKEFPGPTSEIKPKSNYLFTREKAGISHTHQHHHHHHQQQNDSSTHDHDVLLRSQSNGSIMSSCSTTESSIVSSDVNNKKKNHYSNNNNNVRFKEVPLGRERNSPFSMKRADSLKNTQSYLSCFTKDSTDTVPDVQEDL